jgi:hydrogenase maturation factor HypF (carbamoyltransferase family)
MTDLTMFESLNFSLHHAHGYNSIARHKFKQSNVMISIVDGFYAMCDKSTYEVVVLDHKNDILEVFESTPLANMTPKEINDFMLLLDKAQSESEAIEVVTKYLHGGRGDEN